MSIFNLERLLRQGKKEILGANNLEELRELSRKYLGAKSTIKEFTKRIKSLSRREREKAGKEINEFKSSIRKVIEKKGKELKGEGEKENKRIDVTIPVKKIEEGHLHPLTQVSREVENIFQSMGFSIAEGPEIETEWYNFDALNIPKDHPARDMWDTFWLKEDKLLLRTHTSPVQVRYMEKHEPPLRIIAPGKVFRHEATDSSHEAQFYQLEGLVVDENITISNFKAIVQEALKRFFKKNIKIRLRQGFFPFTEPSFELDIQCLVCGGKGCSTCGHTGWIELCPGGMVHPKVLEASGLNPKFWQGFAFGLGLDRLAMMKYKIPDIRLFYSGDLRFLYQF